MNPVEPENWTDYISSLINCVSLLCLITLSTYLARSRKLICDYFYHRYSKERTLYLYNDRLRKRKLYLKERIGQLKQEVEGKWNMCS